MNTEKSLILSNPAAGWCSFTLKTDEGEFHTSLSYLTDVMLDTLKACLTALQTEAAAVMYNRESEGTFLFVLSDHDVYILDENLESGMIRFENISVTEICEMIWFHLVKYKFIRWQKNTSSAQRYLRNFMYMKMILLRGSFIYRERKSWNCM